MTSYAQVASHSDIKAARGLGYASIAIGLTELTAPHQVEKMLGIGNGRTTDVLRVLGIREILHGIDILAHENPAPGVRARVVGDVLDGILLGIAGSRTRNIGSFVATTAAVLGVVALDIVFAIRLARNHY
jgi:hypothetical protein